MTEGLIDFGTGRVVPFEQLAEDWLAAIAEDADALDSQPAVAGLRDMIAKGSAAERQRRLYAQAIAAGAGRDEAFRAVVMSLIEDFRRDI